MASCFFMKLNVKHKHVSCNPVKGSPVYLLPGVVSARALPAGPGLHVLHRVGRAPEHLLAAEGAGNGTGSVHLYFS